jgi:putative (di)nucleoside polyphosphate hydrolase
MDVIDADGYRANVGIILANASGLLLIGGRVGQEGWQFPQGGMQGGETPLAAMYRELHEEVGLAPVQVEVLGSSRDWLRYRLPEQFIRRRSQPLCIGQKQRWFLLRLATDAGALRVDASATPEFDRLRWVDFWDPVREVIWFKRPVYLQALAEFAPLLHPAGPPPRPAWWQADWDGEIHG